MVFWQQKRGKILAWVAAVLVGYTLLGFFILPALVKYALVKKMPELLNRRVVVEKVRCNPYTFKIAIQGFELRNREDTGHFVAFDDLMVNLEVASLYKRALIVKGLVLGRPRLDVTRQADDIYNFSDLLVSAGEPEGDDVEPGSPVLFSINNIEIIGGEIRFDDRPKATEHRIEALAVAIPVISNLPYHVETFVQPAFAALVNGTKIDLGGMVKPFAHSQETSIELTMVGIDIPSYLAYVPYPSDLLVRSALVDLDVRVSYVNLLEKGPRLSLTGEVVVRDVEVVDHQERSYLRLPRLVLDFADANLLAKKIHLHRLALEEPAMEVWRQKDGAILPLALLADVQSTGQPPQSAAEVAGEEETSLVLDIDLFQLTGGSARFHDAGLGGNRSALLGVDDLDLTLENFSTVPGRKAECRLSLRLNRSGSVAAQGQVAVSPLFARLDLDLADIALEAGQPYVQEHVNLAIADGVLAGQGQLAVETVSAGLAVSFQGRSLIDRLALVDSVHGDDLLAWQSLRLDGISFSNQPQALIINDIVLEGPAAQILVLEDGSSNLSLLPVAGARTEGEPTLEHHGDPATPGPSIAIGRVTVEEGRLAFADRKVRPAYGAVIDELKGQINGLSSARQSQAVVELSGKVNRHAHLVVSGTVNPLQEKLFVDLLVAIKNLDLSHASPYTGTYAGYKTEKGKLNLDLQYLVDDRILAGKNKLFLDQFTLGEKVESPDDLNLPVSLAIALLKNRRGEITLDIPVAGNLDDPEFSIGGVVFQVIVNLIAKAATSPFALLGALIPAGEDLQMVPFAAGLAEISEAGQARLDKIAYVLFERPGLRMDLMGQVDEEADRRALAHQLLVRMMKLRKLQEAKLPQDDKAVQDAVRLSEEEYGRYLTNIYELRRQAAGQVEVPGVTKSVAEMEEYVVADLKVPDDQLRLLAIERANHALHYLAEQGGIARERLFVVEPQGLEGQGGDAGLAAVRMVIK